MGTVILGTGSYLPAKTLTNDDLEKIVETNDEWITSRTGIKERRIASKGEDTYILATRAAEQALDMANLTPKDIDVIIVGTISGHTLMPSCACFVQKELGAVNAFAFDINAACSGFLYGLDLGDNYVRADNNKKVLIIGAEVLSSRVDWTDRNTCILFGDGAGAVVLGHDDSNDRGVIGSNLLSDGNLWNLLYMHGPESKNPDLLLEDHPGCHMLMEGKEVFKYAVKAMESAIRDLLDKEKVALQDIKLVIPHQANVRILNKLLQRLDVDDEVVFINVPKYGNTSAASIPIALDEANRSGLISKGDSILFCSFGGGFTWGASLIKW